MIDANPYMEWLYRHIGDTSYFDISTEARNLAWAAWQGALATQSDLAVGMAMTNEQGEKYGALLDSSIPDRTPLYAAQRVNAVTDIHHDPSWQEGYKEGYDDAEIVCKAAGVETSAPTQGADTRPVAIYQVERLAREVEIECLAGSGVSFYMVAEMAIERTIEMLAGPSMQIAEVCQDADGFKHIESVIEDLDDIPAGTRLYATRDAAPSVATKPREVKRDSDFSVTVVFSSCRLASEFERQMIDATDPREKT